MSEPLTETPAEVPEETPETETPEVPEPETPETPDEPEEKPEHIDGDDETPEPPAEPEPTAEAPAMDEKAIEKAHRDAEKLRKDVAGRVSRIFGEDVVHMVECPLCSETAPGWLWDPQKVELQDDHLARVLLALGVVGPKRLKHDPYRVTCPTCDGEGQLETGSKVPGMNVIDCETCAKKGWVDSRQNAPVVSITPTTSTTTALTGPLHYTPPPEQEQYDDDPAVQSLRDRGFLVVAPIDNGVRVS